ncbi:hypothetical protein DPMN_095176 [Dreissena polymorpha]|uniref:Tyrosine-protein kinase ephrin type A/B receptor-like domain-containing protein n=1 Tax=Dreissena polymorpha TaxID=45954 RepID=A0A9D4L7G8_DREPO|nr:hypothetical protein DPMN_095176 [Dreissena polymorpha]
MQSNAVFNDIIPSASKTAVKEAVLDKFKGVHCVATKTCEGNASIDDSQQRGKRSTTTSITIFFTNSIPNLNSLNIAGYIENGTVSPDLHTLQEAFKAIQEILTFLENNAPTIFSVVAGGVNYTVDPASIESFLGAYCKPGFSGRDGMCVECSAGTYQDNAVCRSCDVGTYQPSTGQTTCEPCPNGYTTAAYMATSIAECNVLTTRPPVTLTTQKSIVSDKTAGTIDAEHALDNHYTIPIIISGVIVAVAFIAVITAVVCFKIYRKHSRTSRSRSLASINMVYPNVATPAEHFDMMSRKTEQTSNVQYVRHSAFVCKPHPPPPPYEEFSQTNW